MTRIRRGGYVFLTWTGDHSPRHVHVYHDGRLVTKWDLDEGRPMTGHANSRVIQLLDELKKDGLL